MVSNLRQVVKDSKVNPFLYASPLPTLLNGMLLHTPSHMHDRFTPTSTEAREEARDIKPDKTEAWKRRRKKPRLNHRSLRPWTPVFAHFSSFLHWLIYTLVVCVPCACHQLT